MANYIAKWGNKGFIVSPSKIVPLLGLSTSYKRKSDTNNDTSGTPTTNTRGMELQEVTLETTYLAGAGVDPRAQLEDWRKQFGQRYPLYINGKQFGADLFELDSVDVGEIITDDVGNFIKVDMSITLVEYSPTSATASSKTITSASRRATTSVVTSSSTTQAAKTTATTAAKTSALSAKPTTAQKTVKVKVVQKTAADLMWERHS